jgi:hypothetical protein
MEHLFMISNAAPDRVGIYGLLSQEPERKKGHFPPSFPSFSIFFQN